MIKLPIKSNIYMSWIYIELEFRIENHKVCWAPLKLFKSASKIIFPICLIYNEAHLTIKKNNV